MAEWSNAKNLVAYPVVLSHLKDRYEILMFPDASDNHWGSFLTQVPNAELEDGVEAERTSHGPLGFLSGPFVTRGSDGRLCTRRGSPWYARFAFWSTYSGEECASTLTTLGVRFIGAAKKTCSEFESQAEMVFQKNSGDLGHFGLRAGLTLKKAEPT